MSISKTELVNKALTLVGSNAITSLDDDTNSARVVNRVYETSLRSLLSECKWNFATKRSLLTVSTDTLDWYDSGETIIYQRPADLIKIFGVSISGTKWREEGEYIISDTSGLGIRYVYYLDTPAKYTPQFIDALVDKLCENIAYMIVNSSALAENFMKKYEKISLPKAMASNSQIGKQQTLEDSAWEIAKGYDTQVDA